MPDFSLEISNFERNGFYTYKFDEVSNSIFNSGSMDFSQVYLSFPIANFSYNNNKISSFYDLEFREFIPASSTPSTPSTPSTINVDDIQQQLDVVQQENVQLKSQLDSLIETNSSNTSASEKLATKQVILELRKAIGQGRVESDFSDTFPYTPIKKIT